MSIDGRFSLRGQVLIADLSPKGVEHFAKIQLIIRFIEIRECYERKEHIPQPSARKGEKLS